jgi:hypothetical protein
MKSAQRTAIVGERAIAILVVLLPWARWGSERDATLPPRYTPASMAMKKDFFGDEAHHWLMCTSGSQSRHDAAVVPDQWNFMCSVPVSHASASQSFLISFFLFFLVEHSFLICKEYTANCTGFATIRQEATNLLVPYCSPIILVFLPQCMVSSSCIQLHKYVLNLELFDVRLLDLHIMCWTSCTMHLVQKLSFQLFSRILSYTFN